MKPNGIVTIATWSVLSVVVFLSIGAGRAQETLAREAAARGIEARAGKVRFAWGAVIFEDVNLNGRVRGRVAELRVGKDARLDARGGHIEAQGDPSVIVGRPLELHDVSLVRSD
jgi:hypothetical protein